MTNFKVGSMRGLLDEFVKQVEQEYDGILVGATFESNVGVYWGRIYGDKKGRFNDGDSIHTSRVISKDYYQGYQVVNTRNSKYLMVDSKVFERELNLISKDFGDK